MTPARAPAAFDLDAWRSSSPDHTKRPPIVGRMALGSTPRQAFNGVQLEAPGGMQVTTTGRRATAGLCAFVGALAGVAAGLGVFGRGDGTFVSATSALGESYELAVGGVYAGSARQLVAEGVGWDVFTLIVAVPILLVAALYVARGSFRGALVAAGMLGYFLYMTSSIR